jgi:hypothetical protein
MQVANTLTTKFQYRYKAGGTRSTVPQMHKASGTYTNHCCCNYRLKAQWLLHIWQVPTFKQLCTWQHIVQGGSNMTGTNYDLFTHKQSRSYLNHLVLTRFVTFSLTTNAEAVLLWGRKDSFKHYYKKKKKNFVHQRNNKDLNTRRSLDLIDWTPLTDRMNVGVLICS